MNWYQCWKSTKFLILLGLFVSLDLLLAIIYCHYKPAVMDSKSETFWTAFGAISTLLGSIAGFGAILYAMYTLKQQIIISNNTNQDSYYATIDSAYYDLLKEALNRPYLIHKEERTTKKQEQEYDIYAFMMWNFLETIYDRCEYFRRESERRAKDDHLIETWYPVIDVESRNHGEWFERPDNYRKLKKKFREFMKFEFQVYKLFEALKEYNESNEEILHFISKDKSDQALPENLLTDRSALQDFIEKKYGNNADSVQAFLKSFQTKLRNDNQGTKHIRA